MTCHKVESLLADYLDGQLQTEEKNALEVHLKTCTQCRKTLEEYQCLFSDIKNDQPQVPDLTLYEKFNKMLQREIDGNANSTAASVSTVSDLPPKNKPMFYKIAAGILLIITGFLAGILITNYRYENKLSTRVQPDSQVKEETTMIALLNDASASNRIKAVNNIDNLKMPDSQMLTALIRTMNQDKNINVRLAALYALTKYSDDEMVNNALITSLSQQTEPLMQIALINVLTEKQELKATAPIRNILQDNSTDSSVRVIAAQGLKALKI